MYKIFIISVFAFFLSLSCSKDDESVTIANETEELTDAIQDSADVSDIPDVNQDSTDLSALYQQIQTTILSLPTEELSEFELSSMIHMREEEKLARDVYQYLYAKYEMTIFTNIMNSEETHMFAVEVLLNKYNIVDPAETTEPGVFKDESLQSIYDSLIAKGNVSLTEALIVGAIIEDLDIMDLNHLLENSDNQDFKYVFENLNLGSRNHLRGFYPQVLNNNGEYAASYISQEEFDAVVTSSKEIGTW
ncbi:DUF2202 domain-containing protein [Yeosuana marina]|uniref:DUF2202 domain-containing protein n=1 Tax=Yeosuana marina TaxID=1565536 RepID=UPI0030C7EA1C